MELDSHMPESVTFQPVKIAEISNLNLGARDFIYVEDRGLLFVAMSEMNITSRMDSYITNVSGTGDSLTEMQLVFALTERVVSGCSTEWAWC